MIYEIRTYDIKPTMVPEYQKRFSQKLPGRAQFSPLGGHWYTEAGPINQIIAIWPYENLEERTHIRAKVEEMDLWPPDTGDLVESMVSGIYLPAPFMRPLKKQDLGPIYELRIYTYPPEDIQEILRAWGEGISAREELSPMVGCWYNDAGGHGNFVHMWAYRSFDERLKIREKARDENIWPPPTTARLARQTTKILLPASFSPLQ